MINFDDYINENKTEHNLKWPYIRIVYYRQKMTKDVKLNSTHFLF